MTPERTVQEERNPLIDACLTLVDEVVTRVAAKSALDEDEAADLRSAVYVKLLEDDGAVLRRFRGRSSLATYLTAVVRRLLLDLRAARWGKWRPSMAARRLGPLAVELERLTSRDGLSLQEAVATLTRDRGRGPSPSALAALAEKLPPRGSGRPHETAEPLPFLEGGEPVDARALDAERGEVARHAHAVLRRLLAELGPEDRRLLELRFDEDLTVTEIAAVLAVERRSLYVRLRRCLDTLEEGLRGAGLGPQAVADVLGWSGYPLYAGDGRLEPRDLRAAATT